MNFQVVYKPSAGKELKNLDRPIAARIVAAIDSFAEIGQGDVKQLRGNLGGYRLRVGDYRILFDLDGDRLLITIVKVAHRREAYKD